MSEMVTHAKFEVASLLQTVLKQLANNARVSGQVVAVTNDWPDDQRSALCRDAGSRVNELLCQLERTFFEAGNSTRKVINEVVQLRIRRARFTQPYFSAVTAIEIVRPAMISSARDRPARAVSHSVAPPPGTTAQPTSICAKIAFSRLQNALSQARAIRFRVRAHGPYFGDTNHPRCAKRVTKAGHSLKRCCAWHIRHNFSSHDVVVRNEVFWIGAVKRDDFDILIIFDLIHQHSQFSEHLRIKEVESADC